MDWLFGNKLNLVLMTCEFLTGGRQAHSHYVIRLEGEKLLAEKKKNDKEDKAVKALEEENARAAARTETKSIADKEKELNIEEVKHTEKMEVRTDLFKEANAKLKAALKTKDFKQIAVAQAMLDAVAK